MHIHQLDLALPLLALAMLVGLLKLLRHLLRVHDRVPADADAVALPTSDSRATSLDPWARITSQWNRWITWVLPVPVGICILVLAGWFLAYLGWAAAWVVNRPVALAAFPPWFGSAELLIENVFWGCVTLVILTMFSTVLGLFAHLVGKCLIWPEACGCGDDDAPRR